METADRQTTREELNRLLSDEELGQLQLTTLQYYLHESNPVNDDRFSLPVCRNAHMRRLLRRGYRGGDRSSSLGRRALLPCGLAVGDERRCCDLPRLASGDRLHSPLLDRLRRRAARIP